MSVSQELNSLYRELSSKTQLNIQKLIYGENGFLYSVYPEYWNKVFRKDKKSEVKEVSLSTCDIIYDREKWNEFSEWLKKEKGIDLNSKNIYN